MAMDSADQYDHILIRDATVLVRVPRGYRRICGETRAEFFDVKTGVQLRQIYPDLQEIELDRGYLVSEQSAGAILKAGMAVALPPSVDSSKVVTILEVKQRKLDSVVADSILDQLAVIAELLNEYRSVAEAAQREERFWLSQQVLTLVRKFSGRELAELREIVDWFKSRPHKK